MISKNYTDISRRNFLKYAGAGFSMGLLSCTSYDNKPPRHDFGYLDANYLRPPGALPEKKFVEQCVNCVLCAESCPRGCIKFFTESLEGRVIPDTPYIVAAENACDLCLKCTLICPTSALLPVYKPEDVRMGLAVIKENLCFPYINQSVCGACYTICPLNAIELEMQRYPKVINDKCVGCGLCEEICPQKVKAVRIFEDESV